MHHNVYRKVIINTYIWVQKHVDEWKMVLCRVENNAGNKFIMPIINFQLYVFNRHVIPEGVGLP